MNSQNNNTSIDIVVYWVDGNDPAWQAKKSKYMPIEKELTDASLSMDSAKNRYRDWDNLKYLFRGLELYAPWARHIYFISDEQLPDWLNTDHEKLVIVNHSDFIPKEYLPVFSANPIELNFHRLPGISEQFIVFNDDFFMIDHMKEEDFFKNGKPVDILMEYPIMCSGYNPVFSNILANGFNLVGKHFDRKEYKKRLKSKILSPKYGAYLFYNLAMYMLPFPKFFGLLTPHFARPYLKSSYEKLWELEGGKLDETCHNRFRDRDDVNMYVFRNYNILTGNFEPANIHKMGKAFFIRDNADAACQAIRKQSHKLICLNDDCDPALFEKCKREVLEAFESILPDKSGFEK